MKTAGLTGGIGTGKSTVARMLVERGARLVDADRLARMVVEPDQPAWRDIVAEFGEEVLREDRTLNREALAQVVFNDPDKRELLNRFTHPRIGKEMLRLLAKNRDEGALVTIVDAALLLESAGTKWIKPVIVVTAPYEVKIARVCKRDGLCREDVEARIRSQWSDAQRVEHADYVIDNGGDLASLEAQVDKVWQALTVDEGQG